MMLMLVAGRHKAQFVLQISPNLKAVMNEAIYAPDTTHSLTSYHLHLINAASQSPVSWVCYIIA